VASGLEAATSGLEAPAATGERRRAWLPAATMDGGARRKPCVAAGLAGKQIVVSAGDRGREGREGGAVGFFAKKRLRLRGWRAVECKMARAQSVAFGWRSGAPDLSFHSLHWWGGFHLIRSLPRNTSIPKQ
jgi:hypothetical protein